MSITRKAIAEQACKYANEQIVRGCSHLKNNTLSQKDVELLDDAILRKVRSLMPSNEDDPYGLLSKALFNFEETITISSKYSLGNCYELSHQAMDFLINLGYNFNFIEIMTIEGRFISEEDYIKHKGDHAFVVIDRNRDSDLNNIKEWGEDCIICDPWANDVYFAREFQGRLKVFYRQYDKESKPIPPFNRIKDYDHHKHLIVKEIDNLQVKEESDIHRLLKNYSTRLNSISEQIKQYSAMINTRILYLTKRHGDEDEKKKLLENKFEHAYRIIDEINQLIGASKNIPQDANFRELYMQLRKNINHIYTNLQRSLIVLNDNDSKTISKSRSSSMQLFRKKTTATQRHLKRASISLIDSLVIKSKP